ncbi:hypothetical protein BD289DRAFT_15986 [Coniella lustricola]|uniref:Uncharacterized protein n=1 Tax=Coniella lustricola TaxID=2025994 RepID=A0A2T3A3W0_9PEZI|nr:hypothetical protein BD289DRAFT_15986 [Coniella lustricola]
MYKTRKTKPTKTQHRSIDGDERQASMERCNSKQCSIFLNLLSRSSEFTFRPLQAESITSRERKSIFTACCTYKTDTHRLRIRESVDVIKAICLENEYGMIYAATLSQSSSPKITDSTYYKIISLGIQSVLVSSHSPTAVRRFFFSFFFLFLFGRTERPYCVPTSSSSSKDLCLRG